MNIMPKKIDLDLKDQRQALLFGIFIGFLSLYLYKTGIIASNSSWIWAIIFSIPCFPFGFISGLIYFSDKNPLGIFLPFLAFYNHYLIFGHQNGDGPIDVIAHIWYFIWSILIVILFIYLIGLAIKYIRQGK